MRQCSETGEVMYGGWVLCDDIYIKYEKDLDNYLLEWAKDDGLHNFNIEWLRDYYFNSEMFYYTTWYDEED